MMYYVGETFDKEQNKSYKTEKGAAESAQKKGLKAFDENGAQVFPIADASDKLEAGNAEEIPEGTLKPEGAADQEQPDGQTPDAEKEQPDNSAPDAEKEQEGADQEQKAAAPEIPEGVVEVKGKIQRVFNGAIRIRRRPSWSPEDAAGITRFEEKKVKALHNVDGMPMYETADGYFITGDEHLVKFIPEE